LGDPSGYIEQVHDAGGIVMHTVGTAEEARRAVASGVDVVVAQGWEAGGHVWGTVATLPLVPAVVDAVAPATTDRRPRPRAVRRGARADGNFPAPRGAMRGSDQPARKQNDRARPLPVLPKVEVHVLR
jgi:hypothetical protein